MSYNITVEGGTSVRLPTAGKYCDRDIIVTAEGGGLALDVVTASALPDTVVDGQIVVITDTAAGTVYIDTDEPASPASGDLWIEVAAGGDAALTLTEETPYLRNGLSGTKQWDGAAWVLLAGYLGVEGTWVQFAKPLPTIGTAINDMSWDDISLISSLGLAADYFKCGDAKQITINGAIGYTDFSNLSVWAYIIGIYHDPEHEGGRYIHFQIGKSDQTNGKQIALADSKNGQSVNTDGYYSMNNTGTNSGGWKSCKMRTVLLGSGDNPLEPKSGTYLAALPSDLRNVMKATTKYTDNTGGGGDTATKVTATTEYLWLLSEYEVFGTRTLANSAEQNYQKQYDYYASGNSALFYLYNAQTANASWWLRSPNPGNALTFNHVTTNGSSAIIYASNAYYSQTLAPAFCV